MSGSVLALSYNVYALQHLRLRAKGIQQANNLLLRRLQHSAKCLAAQSSGCALCAIPPTTLLDPTELLDPP